MFCDASFSNASLRDALNAVIARPLRTLVLMLAGLAVLPACTPPPPETMEYVGASQTPEAGEIPLQEHLDRVLDFTLQGRQLNTDEHGAWQILHGVLAYQHEFPVRVGKEGPFESALAYALSGGKIDGWTFQPGDVLDPATRRRGLRAIVEPGTKKGQGHADQWLAILSQSNLPREQTIKVGSDTFTIQDLVDQICRDVPYNIQQEWSWTLIGFTQYFPTTHQWTASDGQTWSIERMLEAELEQDINSSACGGTHRLIGIAMALNRHRAQGGAITGPWKAAEERVAEAAKIALATQNPDGSFSTEYFRRPGSSPDMAVVLGSTGHILEFLAIALDDQQLRDPQVELAVRHLCGLFETTRDLPLECGALYHAAHGLVLYRERVFGPRTYLFEPSAS